MGPLAASAFICSGVSMPGIIMACMPFSCDPYRAMSMCAMCVLPLSSGLPRSSSHCFMYFISSVCEMLMRLPMPASPLLCVREGISAVISTACEWCMIMPCMNLVSASAGARGIVTAASGERILLLCPGAPGWTMGAGAFAC